jgi:glucose/mannose-6-phosphate isomerase
MSSPILDDHARLRELDRSGMAALIARLPDQFTKAISLVQAVIWPAWPPDQVANIVVLGMGGSAIGGDLVRSFVAPDLALPFQVIRDYHLPGFVSSHTLVFASSYSGNTEETLTTVAEAASRGGRMIAVTSGGQLAGLAQEHNWPLIQLPAGFPPRAALGYSFASLLLALGRIGLIEDYASALRKLTDFLTERGQAFSPEIPLEYNSAKQLAAKIQGRLPAIYGAAGPLAVAALRWKGQMCENAENLALAGEAPEFNHNEVVGWGLPAGLQDHLIAIMLRSPDDHPRIARRFEIVAPLFSDKGTPVETVHAEGTDALQRLFSVIQFGDWVSLYLAVLNGVDPTAITAINHLKSKLGQAAN